MRAVPGERGVAVPSSVSAPDEFFESALAVFQKAASGRLIERHYRMGKKAVRVRFAGSPIAELFSGD